jgi:hypothetical protein
MQSIQSNNILDISIYIYYNKKQILKTNMKNNYEKQI